MAQQNPGGGPSAWESAITSTADISDLTPSPSSTLPARNWGYGKVDVFEAVAGEEPVENNRAPTAELGASRTESAIDLDTADSTDPDGDTIEYRFDIDYDGSWDVAWQSTSKTTVSASEYGETLDGQDVAKVQVRDAHGRKAAALTTLSGLTRPDSESDTGVNTGTTPDEPDATANWGDGGTLNRASSASADSNGCGCSSRSMDGGMPVSLSWLLLIGGVVVIRHRR
jgi:uncharacterized protein (TIGR03382 family)